MNATQPCVITIGETMLLFTPSNNGLLETTNSVDVSIYGSETNVAVGLERLGVHSGWIGKLPANALGNKICNSIRALGVDVEGIVWAETGRVGTIYAEWGSEPRPNRTIYDRKDSVASSLKSWELNWNYIERAEWLHMSGILPSMGPICRMSALEIAKQAQDLGIKLSFNLKYRPEMWQPIEAREAWHQILPYTSIIITSEEDAFILCDQELPRKDIIKRIYNEYRPDAVVLNCGKDGSMAFNGARLLTVGTWSSKIVNVLGANDAFDAGFLYGYITESLHKGLAYGNAMEVLKMTIPQTLPTVNREDVDRLVAGVLD